MSAIVEKDKLFHSPICNKCKHYIEDLTCTAFEVIPDEILTGDNDHKNPLKEQNNNIVFEPKETDKRDK